MLNPMLKWFKKHLFSASQEINIPNNSSKALAFLQFEQAANFKEQGSICLKQGKSSEARLCYEQAMVLTPEDPTIHNQLGNVYHELSLWKEAEKYYRQALSIKPNFVNAMLNLALTLDESGQLSEAESWYRKLISIEPTEALAHYNLSVTLKSLNRLREAQASCQQALKLKPEFSHALIQIATLYHLQGQSAKAETTLRKILENDTQFVQAHWVLASILHQQNRLDEAITAYLKLLKEVPRLQKARDALLVALLSLRRFADAEIVCREINLDTPDNPATLYNLGLTLKEQGKQVEAEIYFKQALTINPNFVEANYNLGLLQVQKKCLRDAELSFEHALKNNPAYLDAYRALSQVQHLLGHHAAAKINLQKAVVLNPDLAQIHFELAILLQELGEVGEAEIALRRAIEIMPAYVAAHGTLGVLLMNQERYPEAEACLQHCLLVNPVEAAAYDNLGLLYYSQERYPEAVNHFKKALEINPELLNAINNLGSTYKRMNRLVEAEKCYNQLIKLNPHSITAHNNLTMVFLSQRNFVKAEASYRQVIALQSNGLADAYIGVANILNERGCVSEALTYMRSAIKADPNYLEAYCSLLFLLCFGDQGSSEEYRTTINTYTKKLTERIKPYTSWENDTLTDSGRKLRIGFVSADFGKHPVGYFLKNVIEHFDYKQMELVAFSNKAHNDSLNTCLRQYFSDWHNIENVSDHAAAKTIHEQCIDILIDLSGHTTGNRLHVFAFKPAPLQISWLGYFATTGVPGIDYVLADHISVPAQHEEYFSEKIWYLPGTRLCLTPPTMQTEMTLAENPLPAIRNGYITFGSFQSIAKLNDFTLDLWSEVLQSLPDAKLRIQSRQLEASEARLHLKERLRQFGIASERVTLHGPSSRDTYLAAHKEIDIILDTFPYAGGTTTCEALWAGVPTLTLTGQTMASRQGASLLSYAGLKTWIAKDKNEFVVLAVEYANNTDQLAQLRLILPDKVLASPIFNAPHFTFQLQEALHGMWSLFRKNRR
ncbi:tetratricopeptide repeat protein [Undibacterium sp. JH2W]|uniref:tetratricopeptide repeat protein n=1 Tax=Undibacterium sp. JH2W TaxID=3413037 RepID=UPI003BF18ACF